MREDVDRWNLKYSKKQAAEKIEPDSLLIQYQDLIQPYSLCLDLAGGIGNNGLYLCQRNCDSLIIDCSERGLRLCQNNAQYHGLNPKLVVADLDHFQLRETCFDVILVFRYLNRNLIESIKSWLKPKGLLIYKTFNLNQLKNAPGFTQDYLLRTGELVNWFSDWHCIDNNDHSDNHESTSYWVGRKH